MYSLFVWQTSIYKRVCLCQPKDNSSNMLFLTECARLFTHVSVQHSAGAVEIQSLQCGVKDNPVIIVVQQCQ